MGQREDYVPAGYRLEHRLAYREECTRVVVEVEVSVGEKGGRREALMKARESRVSDGIQQGLSNNVISSH